MDKFTEATPRLLGYSSSIKKDNECFLFRHYLMLEIPIVFKNWKLMSREV